ncbi:unnamed protein product [Orchesella dallaii]|uniref:Uncharacterized protein n=1 Tax=Orchesella dallaii TaxID=48710 RepID=A0ABP1RB41_9HEXA
MLANKRKRLYFREKFSERCKTETFWDSVDLLTKFRRKGIHPINTLVENGGKLVDKGEISDALANAFLVKKDSNCNNVDIDTQDNHYFASLSPKPEPVLKDEISVAMKKMSQEVT